MNYIVVVFSVLWSIQAFAVSYVWNGSAADNQWNTSANWTPVGIPGTADNATINAGAGAPVLAGPVTITALTVGAAKVIDLNTFTLTLSGNLTTSGNAQINNGKLICSNTGASISIVNTSIGAKFNADILRVTVRTSTFSDSCYIRKNGAGGNNDQTNGGNTFFGITTIIQNSGSFFEWGKTPYGGDTFKNDLFLVATGSQYLYLAVDGNSTFEGNIYLTVNASAGNPNIRFGQSGVGGKSTQFANKSITTVGSYNFGQLSLYDFTQLPGSTDNRFPMSGSADITVDSSMLYGKLIVNQQASGTFAVVTNSSIRDSVSLDVTRLTIRKSSFNEDGGQTYIQKTSAGGNDDQTNGGNTFYGITTIIQNSGSFFEWGKNPYGGDTFKNNLFVKVTGSQYLYFAIDGNSTFEGNIFLMVNASAGNPNIRFGQSGVGGKSTQFANKSITANGSYNFGQLSLYDFTQLPGSTDNRFPMSGSADITVDSSILYGKLIVNQQASGTFAVVTNSSIRDSVSLDVTRLTIRKSSFNEDGGQTYIRKTSAGGNDDQTNGGNTFYGITTIIQNSGSFFEWGKSPYGGDTFKNDLFVKVTGSQYLYFAVEGNSTFEENIYLTVNASAGNPNIRFGQSGVGGKSTQFANKSITANGSYNFGQLSLYDFTQLPGSSDNRFPMSGSADITVDSSILCGKLIVNQQASGTFAVVTNSSIRDSVSLDVTRLTIRKSSFNEDGGQTYIRKTSAGGNDDQTNGGNTFYGITTITQNSGSFFEWGKSPYGGDTFKNDLFVKNTGSQYLYFAVDGNSIFEGNIYLTVNASSANSNLRFGQSGVGGKSTQFANKSITTVGSYNFGQLSLYDFTQLPGSTDNRFPMSGSADITVDSSILCGKLIVNQQASGTFAVITNSVVRDSLYLDITRITLQRSSFNLDAGHSYIRKTSAGGNDDQINGGNTFYGITTIIQNSGSFFYWSTIKKDVFENNLILSRTGSQSMEIAYSDTTVFKKDIVFNNSNINVGSGGGVLSSEGNLFQQVQGSIATATFARWSINKPAQYVELDINVTISTLLNLLNAPVDLNSKTLTINNNAASTVVRTNGYIISEKTNNSSKLAWVMGSVVGARVFHFGKYDGTYIPFTFNLTSGTVGSVTVSTYPTDPANLPWPSTPQAVTHMNNLATDNTANTVDRFWQIDKSGASGTATITFTYAESEKPANGESGLVSQRWNSALPDWSVPLPGQTADVTANTVTTPAVSAFSPWTLVRDASPLPVQLVSFTAERGEENTIVKWNTASSTEPVTFTLEKSSDGIAFADIYSIAQNQKLSYQFADELNTSVVYYRLKIVEQNGTFSYSDVVKVSYASEFTFSVFPNPARADDNIQLLFSDNEVNEHLLVLYDSHGNMLIEKVLVFERGEFLYTLDHITNLSAGIYIIQASSDQKMVQKKLIIY